MVPVIRISDETWDRMKKWAVPLEDGPDDVVRRVLDMADEHRKCNAEVKMGIPKANLQGVWKMGETDDKEIKKNGRLPRGLRTSAQAFRRPIGEVLYQLGGRGAAHEVLTLVGQRMKPVLKDVDYQLIRSGGSTRWEKAANFERLAMVRDGFLKDDSSWGIWELTEAGIRWVENQRS